MRQNCELSFRKSEWKCGNLPHEWYSARVRCFAGENVMEWCRKVACSHHVGVTNMWGEVSLCDTPPTLIILQADLVHYFIDNTNITTDNWSQATGKWSRQLQLQLIYYRQLVGQSVLVSGAHVHVSCVRFLCSWRCRSESNVVLDFRIVGVTGSKVVGSVLAGRRLARRVTLDSPISL
jgi:hypothetical protein